MSAEALTPPKQAPGLAQVVPPGIHHPLDSHYRIQDRALVAHLFRIRPVVRPVTMATMVATIVSLHGLAGGFSSRSRIIGAGTGGDWLVAVLTCITVCGLHRRAHLVAILGGVREIRAAPISGNPVIGLHPLKVATKGNAEVGEIVLSFIIVRGIGD